MNKKKYIEVLREEMNNFVIVNKEELIMQAREVMEQLDDDSFFEQMGSPKEYLMELFEINGIKPIYITQQNVLKEDGTFKLLKMVIYLGLGLGSALFALVCALLNFSTVCLVLLILFLEQIARKEKALQFFILGSIGLFILIGVFNFANYTEYVPYIGVDGDSYTYGVNNVQTAMQYLYLFYLSFTFSKLMFKKIITKKTVVENQQQVQAKEMVMNSDFAINNKFSTESYYLSDSKVQIIEVTNLGGALELDTRGYSFENGPLKFNIDNKAGSIKIIKATDVQINNFIDNTFANTNIKNNLINDEKVINIHGVNNLGNVSFE